MVMSFILDNYSCPEFMLNMDCALALQIINNKIKERENREVVDRRWDMYLSLYPHMIMGKIKLMEFADYCKLFTEKENEQQQPDYSNMSDEEMLREIEELEKSSR